MMNLSVRIPMPFLVWISLLLVSRTAVDASFSSIDIALLTARPDVLRIEPDPLGSPTYPPQGKQNETSTANSTLSAEDDVSSIAHTLAGTGNLSDLQTLLKKHPHLVHARDANQWTPLHEAARAGQIDCADLLLQYGAEINARHKHGGTPLYEAELYQGRDSYIVEFLILNGAIREESRARLRGTKKDIEKDPYLYENTAHALAGNGRIEELNHLLDVQGDSILSRQDANGWTVLHEAARMNQVPMARFLVMKGVDLHLRNAEGFTALELAEHRLGKDSEIYQYLLKEETTYQQEQDAGNVRRR